MQNTLEYKYDVVIVGAGPAGAACALALENRGLSVALCEKAKFPRDKVCGDFVSAVGLRNLYVINPELKVKIEGFSQKVTNHSTQLIVNNNAPLQMDWVLDSHTLKREDLDNLLMDQILEGGKVDVYQETSIKEITINAKNVTLDSKDGKRFNAHMIVGADGAHGVVAKSLAEYKVDRQHYGGSVRAYYSGIKNIDPAINEIYIHKDILSGYFWLFPLSDSTANVGLGMHSTHITKYKVDLKEAFYRFMETSPLLQQKLGDAQMEGKLKGFGLPFYSKKYKISGNRFLLCGDAASMIDPSNGEGVMPAIISGKLAAQHLINCFEKDRFDEDFNQRYEDAVHQKFWNEMRLKAWLARTFSQQNRLINAMVYCCNKSPFLRKSFQKFF